MPAGIRIDFDVPMRMRDGTVLRADIYRPDAPGKYPAVLIRTPYGKDRAFSQLVHPVAFAREGYAVVVQDIRGRFASDGVWERHRMFEVEGPDGYDSVEWIAAEPWCDGNVATAGASYLATLQWITAMEAPPHLKAFAPCNGDIAPGIAPPPESGVVAFYAAANALPVTALDHIDRLEAAGQDVIELRRELERMMRDPDVVLRHLPFRGLPIFRFEPIRLMLEQRLELPTADAWRQRRRYDRVNVPGLHIGGWFDQMESAVFANCSRLKREAASEFARANQYLLIGPWDHGSPRSAIGEADFGPAAGDERLLRRFVLDFYDRFLRGRDVRIPAVRYFVMTANEWRTADSWPPPDVRPTDWYLHSRGRANTADGDGTLSREDPDDEPADEYVYDPLDPVPTVGGRFWGMRGEVPGPRDQGRIERRNDVLCYTSAELPRDLEVTGPVVLRLFAASSAVDTDFAAKLTDVFPDGRSMLVAEGIQRARYRRRDLVPEPIEPHRIYEYEIHLGNTSYVFRKGHRIRLHVTSSNFPLYDRNMNTGRGIGEDAEGVPARQTVFHDRNHPSRLVLPIRKE